MDTKNECKRKKSKGGAEKEREKKKKMLEKDASQCQKVSSMFKSMTAKHAMALENPSYEGGSTSSTDAPVETPGRALQPIDATEKGSECTNESYIEEERDKPAILEVEELATQNVPLASHEIDEAEKSDMGLAEADRFKLWFARPKSETFGAFFKFHPCQPNLPSFNSIKLYQRRDGKRRQWLTYSHAHEAFFCTVCLAFSRTTDRSAFIDGCRNQRHMYQRIEQHEESNLHNITAESFLMRSKNFDIGSQVFGKEKILKAEEVKGKHAILERVVKTIKLIGKRGLSYSALTELAYTLHDETLDHGNFLEILLLLSEFDPLLKSHLDHIRQETKEQHGEPKSSKELGSLVTLISKTTANAIIGIISSLLKEGIAQEIREAGMFSIQLDTTIQDINISDHCSVIIRYVTDVVHERLVLVTNGSAATGKPLCNLVCEVLEAMGIDISKCVGSSTDGASNMQRQYNGFTTWLNTKAPGQIHVWCYAHVLNLVMMEVTKSTTETISLFGFLNSCVVFIRESYLQMSVWREKRHEDRFRSISAIGETRWCSKDTALSKVFGLYNDPRGAVYVELIQTMAELSSSSHFNEGVRYRAGTILNSLKRFHTILTAQMYLLIFNTTTPLSLYLQTQGMDLLHAYGMVNDAINTLKEQRQLFNRTMDAANRFVMWANDKLDKTDCNVHIELDFPMSQRVRRKKRLADEMAVDEPIQSPSEKFRVEVYNVTIDKIIDSLQSRFTDHGQLFADLGCLDPKCFQEILKCLPQNALERLSSLVVKFDSTASKEKLQRELLEFASKWDRLKRSLDKKYTDTNIEVKGEDAIHSHLMSEGEEQENANVYPNREMCKNCKNCIACCYKFLLRYNMYSVNYNSLFNAYKLTLTLSSSQVACERSFSKHEYILDRLRNSLPQPHLEAFMLMSIEREALVGLSNDTIIDVLASKSNLYRDC
uniref:HAT C-terminal dimerisation domain-containing protein n=1 Tax=Leptobrachium leishanense TaxID=445787 RepID=A0A8C5PR13_9ANUR